MHPEWCLCTMLEPDALGGGDVGRLKQTQRAGKSPRGTGHKLSPPPPNKLDLSCCFLRHQDHGAGSQAWKPLLQAQLAHKFCFKTYSLKRHHQQKGSRWQEVVKSNSLLYHQEQLIEEACMKLPNCSFSLVLLRIILFIAGNK